MSEEIKNLADAYVKAQAEIGGAVKGSTNPHFKSKYADLGAVMDALKEPLAKHGLSFVQEVTEREGGVYVETVIMHKSGETYRTGKLPMPAPKQDPHGYGSAITYAKRYSLQAAFGVPSEDDDGNKAVEGKQAEQARFPRPVDSALDGVTFDKETTDRLDRIASALTDLVNEEDAETDNEWQIWELLEPITEQDDKLYLSAQMGSKVRARLKVIGAKKRAEANSSGLKKIVHREPA